RRSVAHVYRRVVLLKGDGLGRVPSPFASLRKPARGRGARASTAVTTTALPCRRHQVRGRGIGGLSAVRTVVPVSPIWTCGIKPLRSSIDGCSGHPALPPSKG